MSPCVSKVALHSPVSFFCKSTHLRFKTWSTSRRLPNCRCHFGAAKTETFEEVARTRKRFLTRSATERRRWLFQASDAFLLPRAQASPVYMNDHVCSQGMRSWMKIRSEALGKQSS